MIASGDSTVTAFGLAHVVVQDRAKVWAYDDVWVDAYEQSTVVSRGRGQIAVSGSPTVLAMSPEVPSVLRPAPAGTDRLLHVPGLDSAEQGIAEQLVMSGFSGSNVELAHAAKMLRS